MFAFHSRKLSRVYTQGKEWEHFLLETALCAFTKFPHTGKANATCTCELNKHSLFNREVNEIAAIINMHLSCKGGKESFREEGTLELGLAGGIGVFQVALGKEGCPGRKNSIGKGIEQ